MVAGHDIIIVINSRTDDDRNYMLVEDIVSGNKNKFYTTPHVEPLSCYTCSGYYVNEMVVDDDYNCWFVGSKWTRTGQYIYNIEGLLVTETLYCGNIGKFNAADVLNGYGNFDVTTIPNSSEIEYFTLAPNGDMGFKYHTNNAVVSDGYGDVCGTCYPSPISYLNIATGTATAAPCCRFSNWSVGHTDNPRTIQMLSDMRLVAQFI